MKKLLLPLLAATVLASGCNDPREQRVKELKDETIRIHDEVMPRMGEVNELSVKLRKTKDGIGNDTTDSAARVRENLGEMVWNLNEAHEGMMDWMAAYEPEFQASHSLDSAIHYYEAEKLRIREVKIKVETSIEDAKGWLEEHSQEH